MHKKSFLLAKKEKKLKDKERAIFLIFANPLLCLVYKKKLEEEKSG